MRSPFLMVANCVPTASAQSTASFPIGNGQVITIKDLWYVSTGIFNIVGIRTASGLNLSNVSTGNPISNTLLQNAASPNRASYGFLEGLLLKGSDTLFIDVVDTSVATNTIRFLFPCIIDQ